MIPTPMRIAELANKPGDVLRCDYLYISPNAYICVITDEFSRRTQLTHHTTTNAVNVVNALLKWRANVGLNENFLLVTDKASYYAGKVLKEASKRLRYGQKFAVSYAPGLTALLKG